MFYTALCLIVPAIASGSLAERTYLEAQVWYTLILQLLVLPFIICWMWNESGWIAATGDFFDYGGSLVIFFTGAMCSLVATVVSGPRYGKYMAPGALEKVKGGGR